MKDLIEDLTAGTERGRRVAIATIMDVKRSVPPSLEATMAVNDRGEDSGAVLGGCVEGAVVEAAPEVLRGPGLKLLHFGIADSEAWEVGVPCGRQIDILVEEYA